MKLKDIWVRIQEDSTVHTLHGGNPNLLEFPKENYAVSFFPPEKRIAITPRDNKRSGTRIRSLINDLRNEFRVDKVTQLEMNTFDVRFSPSENFERVRSYIETHGT